MSTYRVVVTREGRDWLADVPALAGAHTDARNLESLDRYVREVIVLAAELAESTAAGLDLAYEFHTGDRDLDRALGELRQARARVEAERADLESRTAAYARTLTEHGYSVRDTGAMLGVSRARAAQLSAR